MNKFVKLFITYGPGSVGSVARWMGKNYVSLRTRFPEITHKETLLMLIELRFPGGKSIAGPDLPESKEKIVEWSNEDLFEVTMWVLRVENKGVRYLEKDARRSKLFYETEMVVREQLGKFDIKQH